MADLSARNRARTGESAVRARRSPTVRRLLLGLAAALVALAAAGCDWMPLVGPGRQLATVTVSPSSATLTALGETRRFTATARDQEGKAFTRGERVTITWSTSEPGVASVDRDGTVTAVGNGTARVTATARREGDSARASVSVTVDQAVASVTVSPDSARATSLGETVTFAADLRDANGNPVADAEARWSSRDTAVATVDSAGVAEARGEGSTFIVAEAGGASDSAEFVVAIPQAKSNLTVSSFVLKPRGVLESETVRAEGTIRNEGEGSADRFEWEIRAGTEVLASGTVDGLAAGSSVAIPTQSGLGPLAAGTHHPTFAVDAADAVAETDETDNTRQARLESYPRGYEIELQFVGSLADTTKQTVRNARDRWGRVITSDLTDITPSDSLDLDRCFPDDPGAGKRTKTIDDLLLLARKDSVDGAGGTLAQAGPCFLRVSSGDAELPPLPVVGVLTLDSADVSTVRDEGRLGDLVLHEIGHTLGFGGLWNSQGGDGEGPFQLLEGAGTDDPVFRGALAIELFLEAGGDDYNGTPVPVANQGGDGTRGSHWRESVFDNELMTGFLNQGANPLSTVTIGSLADMFYAVDLGEADAFQISLRPMTAVGEPLELGDHLLGPPRFGVDRAGRVYRLFAGGPR